MCSSLGRLVDLALPICDMVVDDFRCLLDCEISTDGLNEVTLGVCNLMLAIAYPV
jgi:hypothetical protein